MCFTVKKAKHALLLWLDVVNPALTWRLQLFHNSVSVWAAVIKLLLMAGFKRRLQLQQRQDPDSV